MWAGRAVPEKGMDVVIEIANKLKKDVKLFARHKKEYRKWLNEDIQERITHIKDNISITLAVNKNRLEIVRSYQRSKLFLFPIKWEEPFGLVMVESMACGTPVVVYARGSAIELVKDGETGFVVNPSDEDIRGDWIIKKTGVEGISRFNAYLNSNLVNASLIS
ncbi:glycosyltransferase [Patescibacteria group bacterium]|nr:glycosyltransferase [Patescibacteria group bacterium]